MMPSDRNSYKTGSDMYTYLGIGQAGVYANSFNPWSERHEAAITIYDTRLTPYFGDVAEGGIVCDKRPAFEQNEFKAVEAVISGPMRNNTLPPQTRDSWGQLIPCSDPKEGRGFDSISTDLYLSLWRELGAKIGYRRGNFIEFENGEKTEIPRAEDRWMKKD